MVRYDVLLRPGAMVENSEKEVVLPFTDGISTQRQNIQVAAIQSCECIRGFQRLIVKHYGKLLICPGVGMNSPRCTPFRIQAGKYTVLWNARGVFTPDCGEDSDEDYSACPHASVQKLLRDHAMHLVEANEGTRQDAFEWWTGCSDFSKKINS